MIYLELFYEFFKVGLFAIGGGLATIPFLYDMSTRLGWFTSLDLTNMIAIAESTPGPVGINTATYVGIITGGFLGAVVATIALVLPSIIIIIFVSKILDKFKDSKLIKNIFYGIRPASLALIAAAAYSVIKVSLLNIDQFLISRSIFDLFDFKAIVFAIVLLGFMNVKKFKKIHPIVFIVISGLLGVVFKFN